MVINGSLLCKKGWGGMTKGEVLNQYGLRMIRKDLNEEADEQFVEFVKVLANNFEEIYNENEDSEV